MSAPRQHTNPYAAVSSPTASGPGLAGYRQNSFGSTHGPLGSGGPGAGVRAGTRFLKRLFKFPQMDFEVAVWEMTQLMVAPKKWARQVYYRKQTKNTYATSDPAFPYLLSFFVFLTSLAWSLAYANPAVGNILRIAFWFVVVHCLLSCLAIATLMRFSVGRILGPKGLLTGRLGRRRGLFGVQGVAGEGEDEIEWGFCFDVAIRAFLPPWIYLYVVQFLLLPAVTTRYWPATLLTNTLYLLAAAHSAYITFLGYNALPSLSSTHLLVAVPLAVAGVAWLVASAAGWNASLHLAPILWCAGGLRKIPGGGDLAGALVR